MVPIESLPIELQLISNVVPLTHGIRIMNDIMPKGNNIMDLWTEFLAIGIFCILFLFLALLSIKEEE
ncbi:MAG: hypothetical protein ACFFCQ_13005 [Promethearchaeota archaeon]